MSRIDWIVLRRLTTRIALVLLVFFALLALVGSLDTFQFRQLSKVGGPLLGVIGIVTGAARLLLSTLPVTVLIGSIIGVLDLQSHRELTIINATGSSIWKVVRAPVIGAILVGAVAGTLGNSWVVESGRRLDLSQARADQGTLWLEQQGKDGAYIMVSDHPEKLGTVLEGVTVFQTGTPNRDRIQATRATLRGGAWEFDDATRYGASGTTEKLTGFKLATTTTAGDMRVRMTSARDLTFFELFGALGQRIADPDLRAGVLTNLYRLFFLPVLLAGSVLMGFAFASGYRRTNKYGVAVLYGIVLGFVVYVVNELAIRSGFAGILDPTFAGTGPAFVAVVIGLTVLLYKEDGRA